MQTIELFEEIARHIKKELEDAMYHILSTPLLSKEDRALLKSGLGEYEEHSGMRFFTEHMGKVLSLKHILRSTGNPN